MLHVVDADAPKSYRRKAAPTFVIAIAEVPEPPEDMNELRRAGYPFLVRCLANLSVLVSDTPTGLAVRFVTLEQGTYGVGPGLDDAELVADVFRSDRAARVIAARHHQRLRRRPARSAAGRR